MSTELTIEKKVSPIVAKAQALQITDAKSLTKATEMLSELNKRKDAVEEEKMKVMRPILDAQKAERARWKPVETILDDAISALRRSMTDYKTEADRIAKEKADKIAARVGAGKGKLTPETASDQIDAIETVANSVETDAGSVNFRPQKNFRLKHIDLVPMEYHILDEIRVRADMKKGIEIPGIEYYTEQIPINRRN